MTKFHDYILPAIPGLAIVIGCFLDELWERRDAGAGAGGAGRAAAAAAGGAGPGQRQERLADVPVAVLYDYVHSPRGRPWPDQLDFTTPLLVFGALFAC